MEVRNSTDRLAVVVPQHPNKVDNRIKVPEGDFGNDLHEALNRYEPLKFSGHAIDRLFQRGISLTQTQLERLHNAVESANSKGSRDSLVLLNDMAFVVSVKNRTVVTALQTAAASESVFTNIDSTVIA